MITDNDHWVGDVMTVFKGMTCHLTQGSGTETLMELSIRFKKMLFASIAMFSLVLCAPVTAHGATPSNVMQVTLDDAATLQDYLAYAARNNPGLEAAFNQWKAALERVPQVRALPDPKFEYKYFIEEVETRVGPQKQSFGLMQAFPWFGKLDLAADAAGQGALAAQQRYEAAKQKLFFEVKDAFYEYAYLAQAVKITQDNVDLVKHLESVALSRYQASAASHPAVIRAQVEWGKLDDRHRTLEALQGPLTVRLNAALNRPVQAPLPWPGPLTFQPVDVNEADLTEALGASNPQLRALGFEVTKSERSVRLARKDTRPDFALGLSAIDTGNAVYGTPPDSGKDPVVASLSLTIPLWQEKNRASIREAKLRHLVAQQDKKHAMNTLSAQLQMAVYQLQDAQRKINLYGDTLLPKANESLKVTEAAFRAGSGSFTDLIDAERVLLEFALARERALANYAQSLAKVEWLVGRPMEKIADR
ncbi:MAG: TolC family protein [Phycisphaerae bacterium]|nr:TolC family protein [Phycisphaerae bacterium]